MRKFSIRIVLGFLWVAYSNSFAQLQGDAEEDLAPASLGKGIQENKLEKIDEDVAAEKMGRLEAEFQKLGIDPSVESEAKEKAIREWIEANGDALRLEVRASREADGPSREQKRRENRVNAEKAIDEAVASGKMGELEAEFVKFRVALEGDPVVRNAKIREWRSRNGAALDSERAARRELARHSRSEDRELVIENQLRRLDMLEAAGKIGPLEAQWRELLLQQGLDPKWRGKAIRSWRARNGAALEEERRARKAR